MARLLISLFFCLFVKLREREQTKKKVENKEKKKKISVEEARVERDRFGFRLGDWGSRWRPPFNVAQDSLHICNGIVAVFVVRLAIAHDGFQLVKRPLCLGHVFRRSGTRLRPGPEIFTRQGVINLSTFLQYLTFSQLLANLITK